MANSGTNGSALRLAVFVFVGLVVYGNALGNPFIFDDEGTVLQNASLSRLADAVTPPANTAVAGRPLVNLSFALNYHWGGVDPFGYRAVNLAVHLLCALLVFGVVRRTLARSTSAMAWIPPADLAFATALIFVVHPLTTEVVNYVTQRSEGLMAVCYLLTVYCAIRSHGAQRPLRWQAAAAAACLAGAGCKETIATAPIAVLLWDRAFVFPSLAAALRARRGFYAGLAMTWLLLGAMLAFAGQSLAGGFATARVSWWTYFLNQPRMIARYLGLTVWPGPLVLYYGWPVPVTLADVWPWLLFVTLLFIACVVMFGRHPAAGFVGAWFFLTLGPTSSLITIGTEVAAERRMYLPVIGLIAATVVVLARLSARSGLHSSREVAIAAMLIAVPLGVRTAARNREYASPLTMAWTTLERWPTANAEYLVGMELARRGEERDAVAHLRAAVAYAPARYVLGTTLLRLGERVEATAALESFARDEPQTLAARNAHALLANLYAETGQPAMAIRHFGDYLTANPGDGNAWTQLALTQLRAGSRRDALQSFRRAVAAAPANARYQLNLARALLDEGQLGEARTVATAVAAAHPADPGPHDILARIHAGEGNVAAARAEFTRALTLDPGYAPARDGLRSLEGR